MPRGNGRTGLLSAFLVASAVAFAGDDGVSNSSFEADGDLPAGWTLAVGATSGAGAESAVAIDRSVARDGKASLRLSGDAATTVWRTAQQDVVVHPGDRVTLRVAAKCRGLDAASAKHKNANSILVFETAAGQRLQILGSPLLVGDHDWTDLVIDAVAPPAAAKARIGVVLSIPGTAWFDDVRVDVGPATVADAAGRARAFDALAGHLRRTYPFFGYAGKPEADALFARHRAAVIEAKDKQRFVAAIRKMLAELDDVHVSVHCSFGTLSTARPPSAPANWNRAAVKAALTQTTVAEPNLLAGRIGAGADAIGYVLIGSFQLDAAGLARVDEALDELADAKSLVIDVRPNGGGDESAAARIAGRFTDAGVVYARSIWRDSLSAATDAFGAPLDRELKPVTPGKRDARRVVVLQGPYCVSSTEGFLAMMRALPGVTTMGLASRGASGNPGRFDVVPGVSVFSSRWRSLLLDGDCIEGKGVAPEIVVEGSHAKIDLTLERALVELER